LFVFHKFPYLGGLESYFIAANLSLQSILLFFISVAL